MATKNVARLKVSKASETKVSKRSKSTKDDKSASVPYAEFLPKPLRAAPSDQFERLNFVRPEGSYGGYCAWDPPQPSLELLHEVFKGAGLIDGSGEVDRDIAEWQIGREVGARAARDYARFVKDTAPTTMDCFLSDIVLDMLGTPTDTRRRGEAAGFFLELEDILQSATHRSRKRRAR